MTQMLGCLRRGDVFKWAKPYADENPDTEYVVLNAAHVGPTVDRFGPMHPTIDVMALGQKLALPGWSRMRSTEEVIKTHDASEVEHVARELGLA